MKQKTNPYVITLLLSFFLGHLGIHRFYVGKYGTGTLMLLTGGGLGVWYVIDLTMIILGKFRTKEGKAIIHQPALL
jgi:TM2 domain-containing membrane protein YozV